MYGSRDRPYEQEFAGPRARAVTGAYRFGLLLVFSQDSKDKLKRRPFRSILIKFDVCEKKRTVWTLAAPVGVRRGVRLVPTRASALAALGLLVEFLRHGSCFFKRTLYSIDSHVLES